MDLKNMASLVVISILLFGVVSAQKTVNEFQIDESDNSAYNGNYCSLYLNENHDSGITVYKEFGDDDNETYDGLIHDEGKDYLTSDDDFKLDKNPDNTISFTDYDYAQHGVAEVIDCDGENFVVVFWAKDTSDVSNSDLVSQLNEFNKDNNVNAIAFWLSFLLLFDILTFRLSIILIDFYLMFVPFL